MDPAAAAAPKVEPSGMGSFVTWLEINRMRVMVIGLGVVVITLATVLYLRHESERETRASYALSEVRSSLNPGTPVPAGAVEGYLKVADEYKGSQAAPRALLMAASTLFVEGKFAEAQKVFERTVREYPGNPWAVQASLGVAKSFDAQKNVTEAMTRYEDVRKRFANTSAADEATLGVARMYEAQGKNEDAIKLYHTLSQAVSSSIGARAGFRKEALVERFPELTNAIAPIMPTAMTPPPGMTIVTNMAALGSNLPAQIRTNVISTGPGMSPRPQSGFGVPWRPPETTPPAGNPPPTTPPGTSPAGNTAPANSPAGTPPTGNTPPPSTPPPTGNPS